MRHFVSTWGMALALLGWEASPAVPGGAEWDWRALSKRVHGVVQAPGQGGEKQERKPQTAGQAKPDRGAKTGKVRGRADSRTPSAAPVSPGEAKRPERKRARGNRLSSSGAEEARPRQGAPVLERRLPARPRQRIEPREHLRKLPAPVRDWVGRGSTEERLAAGALLWGVARGLDVRGMEWRREAERLLVLNSQGELLLELDSRRAEELGHWQVRRLGDRQPREGAPSFCRSGSGHPVWGREWCLEKGLGLGNRAGMIWSRGRPEDLVLRRLPTVPELGGQELQEVLGEAAFARLALHSLSLGLEQPLVGRWRAEPGAPRILTVQSGEVVLAELLDQDRDRRVEVLYITQPLR